MITYHSEGFRPIRHDDEHGIDGPRAAAAAFAARLAHRKFGQRGQSQDGMHGHYEAFIGAPTERGTTAGHNVCIDVDVKCD